jgi:hypothetical protein
MSGVCIKTYAAPFKPAFVTKRPPVACLKIRKQKSRKQKNQKAENQRAENQRAEN